MLQRAKGPNTQRPARRLLPQQQRLAYHATLYNYVDLFSLMRPQLTSHQSSLLPTTRVLCGPPLDFSRREEALWISGSFWNAGSPDSDSTGGGGHDPHATLPCQFQFPHPSVIPAEKFSPSLTSGLLFSGPHARVLTWVALFLWDAASRLARSCFHNSIVLSAAPVLLVQYITYTGCVSTFGQPLHMAGMAGSLTAMGCLVPTYAHPSRASPDQELRQDSSPGSPGGPCTLVYRNLLYPS